MDLNYLDGLVFAVAHGDTLVYQNIFLTHITFVVQPHDKTHTGLKMVIHYIEFVQPLNLGVLMVKLKTEVFAQGGRDDTNMIEIHIYSCLTMTTCLNVFILAFDIFIGILNDC